MLTKQKAIQRNCFIFFLFEDKYIKYQNCIKIELTIDESGKGRPNITFFYIRKMAKY